MTVNKNQLLLDALSKPTDAIRRTLTSSLQDAFPTSTIAVVGNVVDNLVRFAYAGHCGIDTTEDFVDDYYLYVDEGKPQVSPYFVWWKVQWQGHHLEVVKVDISEGYHRSAFGVLVAPSAEVAKAFTLELDTFANDVQGAVLVFQDGCWKYDAGLFEDISGSTFDNLILEPGRAAAIQADVRQWLDAHDLYTNHGIPWKRGMILVGPPGNGKTHMVKALVNHFKLSALYVRSFKSEYNSDEQNISSVFERARKCAPSMLILEDLDTLVDSDNRSHFLNEMDGFAQNSGILTVATANDPAKLDPALVNRPSRFDRRHVFSLPNFESRQAYLQFFTGTLNERLKLGDQDAAAIAEETEDFSYAYLKELVLSGMMAWIADDTASFVDTLASQVPPLREQMTLNPSADGGGQPSQALDPYTAMMRHQRRQRRRP